MYPQQGYNLDRSCLLGSEPRKTSRITVLVAECNDGKVFEVSTPKTPTMLPSGHEFREGRGVPCPTKPNALYSPTKQFECISLQIPACSAHNLQSHRIARICQPISQRMPRHMWRRTRRRNRMNVLARLNMRLEQSQQSANRRKQKAQIKTQNSQSLTHSPHHSLQPRTTHQN